MTVGDERMVGDFESFFAAHHDRVRRTVTLAIGDPERAADVTQEAFAVAYRRWRRVREMERPAAYVTVVATNRARRDLRRDGRRPDPPPGAPAPDPAGTVALDLSLHDAIAALAPRQRAAIVLRYLGDLTIADVAAAMGCSEGTAKATIHQALARLRVRLDDESGDHDPARHEPAPTDEEVSGDART